MQAIKFVLVFRLLFKQSFDAFFSHTLTPGGQGRRIDRRLMLKVDFAAEVSPIRILDPRLNLKTVVTRSRVHDFRGVDALKVGQFRRGHT